LLLFGAHTKNEGNETKMGKQNKKRKLSILIGVVAALVVGSGVYVFTASNTVPLTTAGSGAGAVSGYVVTALHYVLDSSTPTDIDSLTFTISPAVPSTGVGKVSISTTLSAGGPTAYTCTTDVAGTTVTCTTTSPQLSAALLTGVSVIAAQ
jgi:hypothetical protein